MRSFFACFERAQNVKCHPSRYPMRTSPQPWLILCILALSLHSHFSDARAQSSGNTIVHFEIQRGTNNLLGTFDVELFDQDKPETVRNFLLYVRSGAYTNSF